MEENGQQKDDDDDDCFHQCATVQVFVHLVSIFSTNYLNSGKDHLQGLSSSQTQYNNGRLISSKPNCSQTRREMKTSNESISTIQFF